MVQKIVDVALAVITFCLLFEFAQGLFDHRLFGAYLKWMPVREFKIFFFLLCLGVIWRLKGMVAARAASTSYEDLLYVVFGSAVIVFWLPDLLIELDERGWHKVLADCQPTRARDYFIYVLDTLLKGFFLNLMESFDLHLYQCQPLRKNLLVQTTTFMIRSFSSVILAALVFLTIRKIRARAAARAADPE